MITITKALALILLGVGSWAARYNHPQTKEIPPAEVTVSKLRGSWQRSQYRNAVVAGPRWELSRSTDQTSHEWLTTINLPLPRFGTDSVATPASFDTASEVGGQTKKPSSSPATEIANIDRYSAELDRFVKQNENRARIFADVSSGTTDEKANWKLFKSEKEREKADTGENLNENAYVWTRAGKVVAVNFTFQSPSRDWAHFVMYFFRDDGSLAKIHGQLNTFYGDLSIIRDHYYSRDGKLLKTKKRFLDLQTQKPKKPGEYQDTPEPVFKNVSELPFFKLL